MRLKLCFLLTLLIFKIPVSVLGQVPNWQKFIPLESTRDEVEKILGKPQKYFDYFGIYQTEIGKFAVWYSRGECSNDNKILQYNVPSQKLINFSLELNKLLPLDSYIASKENYTKSKHPTLDNRYFYFSPDETITYTTLVKNSKEFVYLIGIHPGKDKKHLLCENNKKNE